MCHCHWADSRRFASRGNTRRRPGRAAPTAPPPGTTEWILGKSLNEEATSGSCDQMPCRSMNGSFPTYLNIGKTRLPCGSNYHAPKQGTEMPARLIRFVMDMFSAPNPFGNPIYLWMHHQASPCKQAASHLSDQARSDFRDLHKRARPLATVPARNLPLEIEKHAGSAASF